MARSAILRPFVAVFLLAFLFVAVTHFGWLRCTVFAVVAGAMALAALMLSARYGWPLAGTRYAPVTDAEEMWLGGVPLSDGLVFVFTCHAGYAAALFAVTPVAGRWATLRLAETRRVRGSWVVAAGGGLATAVQYLAMEPWLMRVSSVHVFESGGALDAGPWFGVPLERTAGWCALSAIVIAVFQRFDTWRLRPKRPRGACRLPASALHGVALHAALAAVHVTRSALAGVPAAAMASACAILLPLLVLAFLRLAPRARATPAEIEAHTRDFPWQGVP